MAFLKSVLPGGVPKFAGKVEKASQKFSVLKLQQNAGPEKSNRAWDNAPPGLEASVDAPTTLTELLERYLKEVSSKKKGCQDEVYRIPRRFISSFP